MPIDETAGRVPPRLLVTGGTGMIGSLVVDQLTDRGVPCAVMVRPTSDASRFVDRPGVTVVRADFDDPDSLRSSLEGVERAFLLTNSTERAEAQQIAFVQAASEVGLEHLVKLSQLHPAAASPVRFLRYHAAVEAAIEERGVPFTFVRRTSSCRPTCRTPRRSRTASCRVRSVTAG